MLNLSQVSGFYFVHAVRAAEGITRVGAAAFHGSSALYQSLATAKPPKKRATGFVSLVKQQWKALPKEPLKEFAQKRWNALPSDDKQEIAEKLNSATAQYTKDVAAWERKMIKDGFKYIVKKFHGLKWQSFLPTSFKIPNQTRAKNASKARLLLRTSSKKQTDLQLFKQKKSATLKKKPKRKAPAVAKSAKFSKKRALEKGKVVRKTAKVNKEVAVKKAAQKTKMAKKEVIKSKTKKPAKRSKKVGRNH